MGILFPPFNKNYKRIISVVPSQTELLYSLKLYKEVIGITKFCVHPDAWFRNKQRVGGTKNLNIELIKSLQPNLIIANKEENTQSDIETLSQQFEVYLSDIKNLDDALAMITDVGTLTNKIIEAEIITSEIKECFKKITKSSEKKNAAYVIWKDPYMIAGGDTFINDMMERCGFDNVFKSQTRYPSVTVEDIKNSNCELLLLSSEPYPFADKHIEQLSKLLPSVKVILGKWRIF